MKIGFTTGDAAQGHPDTVNLDFKPHRFIRFKWQPKTESAFKVVSFFNQTNPESAVIMLRQMADKIEEESAK